MFDGGGDDDGKHVTSFNLILLHLFSPPVGSHHRRRQHQSEDYSLENHRIGKANQETISKLFKRYITKYTISYLPLELQN